MNEQLSLRQLLTGQAMGAPKASTPPKPTAMELGAYGLTADAQDQPWEPMTELRVLYYSQLPMDQCLFTWVQPRGQMAGAVWSAVHPALGLAAALAVFPNEGRVVANRYGVFVPNSLFGRSALLTHELNRTPEGDVCVVIRPARWRKRTPTSQPNSGAEQRWLAEHGKNYAGQWVALDGDRLVAHGHNAREVYAAARRSRVELPFVVQVEGPGQLPFGGW